VNSDGSVKASGSAVGGNAHLCSLGADGLRFRRDGWYAGVAKEAGRTSPPAVPVLRFWEDRAEVFENGHPRDEALLDAGFGSFAQCGARAGFDEMIRVPYPPAGAHRPWYAAGMDAGD
jgi:hypothetical protein